MMENDDLQFVEELIFELNDTNKILNGGESSSEK